MISLKTWTLTKMMFYICRLWHKISENKFSMKTVIFNFDDDGHCRVHIGTVGTKITVSMISYNQSVDRYEHSKLQVQFSSNH